MRQTPTSDLRRVRLLGTRTPLQPLPKENQVSVTISDICLAVLAIVAVIALFNGWG